MKKLSLLFAVVLLVSFQLNAQWAEQTSGTTNSLNTISAVDNNVCWIGANGGVVLRTTNGGTNWTSVGGGAIGTADIYNIAAWDANLAICTTSPAATFVYRTTDGGATWAQVFTQTGGFIDAIWMTSASNGFMYGDPVGSRWSLWRTTNGGATWDSTGLYLPQVGTEAGWNNALYIDGSKIYFGTNNSKVYYSTNSGSSWAAQTMALTNSFGIWFNSPSVGLISGSTQGIVVTTNGGTTWSPMTIPAGSGTIYSVTGFENQWYYSRGTAIIGSTNNGGVWTTSYTATAGNYLCLVKARTGNVAWACRDNGGITKGTNVGLPVELTSFTASTSNGSVSLQWRTATETNNRIFEIERKSENTEYLTVGFVNGQGTTTQAHDYTFSDNSVIPGSYSYRLKQIDYDGRFSYSKDVEVEITEPSVFQLSQNYPNPFNPSSTINFSIPSSGLVTLKVYDALGKEVAVMLNEVKEPGSYNVKFNAENLSSGIYLYKMQSGNYIATKKMILLK
jgi:photosystem II stability/assembly factor-like uncharacterized protein